MFEDVTTYIKRTFGHANIGYIMAIFGAGDAIASAIVGKLSDVLGKKVFLILACLIQGGCCTYFFVFKGSGMTFLLMSVIAFAWGVADGNGIHVDLRYVLTLLKTRHSAEDYSVFFD